jgi:hypothetical protein
MARMNRTSGGLRRLTAGRMQRRTLLEAALGAGGLALVGCTAPGVADNGGFGSTDLVAWPAKDQWPQIFWNAPASVQEVYRYAVAHEDELKWMPCFCGCVNQGHRYNFDCYVTEMRPDGSVVLDPMSFG